MPPQRRSRAGTWILLSIVGFGVLCFVGLFVFLLAIASSAGDISGGGTLTMHEERLSGSGTNKIARIDINGIILPQQVSLFGSSINMVARVKHQLRTATEDSNVVAILLAVDSPGGGVTASDELWNEVKKAQQEKPVVVHMGNLCASGGYYVSAPAQHIVASPTSVTGSIGVIMSLLDLSSLMQDKLGVKENNITSGPYKDIGAMSRPMTKEERAILQSVVDDMFERFVDIVAEGRAGHGPIPADEEESIAAVLKIADGRIYTADQALENGLVDEIGYIEDAQEAAKKLAGVTEAQVIRYRRQLTFMDILAGAKGGVNVNNGLQIDADSFLKTPRFLYLWSPGK
jgi:protease-4